MVVDNANNVSKKFCTKNDYGEYTGWSGDLMLSLFSGVKSKSTGFHMRYTVVFWSKTVIFEYFRAKTCFFRQVSINFFFRSILVDPFLTKFSPIF